MQLYLALPSCLIALLDTWESKKRDSFYQPNNSFFGEETQEM